VTYCYDLSGKLSQGDIFRRVRVIKNIVGNKDNAPEYKDSAIIVITRNCEIDRSLTEANSVLIARVRELVSQSSPRFRDLIREGSVLNTFYLPAGEGSSKESYIDWRSLQPFSKSHLYELRNRSESYRCTLTGDLLKSCLGGLLIFLTKSENEEDERAE